MADGTHDLDAVLERAAAWLLAGRGVAFATVIRTWGSSPRPAGSKLACTDTGEFIGSVSGGCIEAAVITDAIAMLAGERGAGVLSFGVADEIAWEVGLACGGKIEVFIEVASPVRVRDLRDARAQKRPVVLLTPLREDRPRQRGDASAYPTGPHLVAGPGDDAPIDRLATHVRRTVDEALREPIARALRTDVAFVVDTEDGAVLVEPHNPPLRLILVGAVHVAAPLAQMARVAGFAVTVVDPRRAWATKERFPHDELVTTWPDVALEQLRIDARTAIVALTHDPKLDDPALVVAMTSPAFYIGCLGSKKTHAARRERLGASAASGAIDRLHGPVGLDIGAKSPAEIAVSILAEIIAALRGRDPRGVSA